jgi:hypothetical protein
MVPAAVVLTMGIAVASDWLKRHGARSAVAVATGVWVLMLVMFGAITRRDAEHLRAEASQLARTLDAALAETPAGATLVIAADPVDAYEASISLLYHLAARGRHDYDIALLLTPRDVRSTALPHAGDTLTQVFQGRIVSATHECADVRVVLLFAPEQVTRSAWPCLAADTFSLVTFSEDQAFSAVMPALVRAIAPPTTIGYALLVRST